LIKKKWIFDILVSLVPGLIVLGVQFLREMGTIDTPIVKIATEERRIRELSNVIVGWPIMTKGLGSVINYEHRIYVWNTGNQVIKDFPVRFVFNTKLNDAKIVSINHSTKLEGVFGDIRSERRNDKTILFTYDLLHPDDEDEVTIVTEKPVGIEPRGDKEGVNIDHISSGEREARIFFKRHWCILLTFIFCVPLLVLIIRRMIRTQEEAT